MVISYEINEIRQRLIHKISYELTMNVRSPIYEPFMFEYQTGSEQNTDKFQTKQMF